MPDAQASATVAAPERTRRRVVCALSGLIATPACPRQIEEWVADDRDLGSCDWHRVTPRGVVVHWPVEYQAWAASERLLDVDMAMERQPESSSRVKAALGPRSSSTAAVRVVNPPDGAVYLIDPTLRREFQTIGLRGAAGVLSSLEWRVDDTPVGTTSPDASLNWPLTPGRHVITARDSQGRDASASIVVK